jgi:signal peptidase I
MAGLNNIKKFIKEDINNIRKKDMTSEEIAQYKADMKKKRISFLTSFIISVVIAALLVVIFNHFFTFIRVSGESMTPTFKNGQHLIIKKYDVKSLKNGDIIVFSSSATENNRYIKRVIAKGGDTIKIDGCDVYVNNELLTETYTNEYSQEYFIGELTIPENYCFVMGDNRDASYDSRMIGLVSYDDIEGIALFQ